MTSVADEGSSDSVDASPPADRPPAADTLRAERIRILSDDLRSTRAELTKSTKELERTQRELIGLKRRRSVRMALAVSERLVPIAALGRRVVPRMGQRRAGSATDQARKPLRATEAEEARLRARLAAVLRPARLTGGPLVSVVIPTHEGIGHLKRLLPALDRIIYQDLEIIVVDNGSRDGTASWLESQRLHFPLYVIANPDNRSFSEANNQAIAAANGEFILLLNNDTEPAGEHVIGHLVDRLVADPAVAAVGSRLIYPRRNGPATGPLSTPADLSLQHRGVAFATASGEQVPVHVGRGEDPLGHSASEPRDIEIATAACLLVRRSAFEAVGGLSEGYDYGMEDVDFSLKLRAAGWRIVYEPQATFWHYESATQRSQQSHDHRAARQMANRTLLQARWGPRIYREAFLDRLSDGGTWSADPLHVGITVTRDDPEGGYGDWYTAHELGEALEQLGWRISYLERHHDRWYDPSPSVDVVVSLLDAFDVRRLPAGIVTIAWVRNWTDRWIARPWFDEFDIVLASSARSKELIDAASVHVAGLMPIATNPMRFRAADPERVPTVDVVMTTNRWGVARGIEAVVPLLLDDRRSVALHGRGWDAVPRMAPIVRGSIAYDDLPAAYADAALVLDDGATSTLPYGSVNSRVFDALAVGTLVITDNVIGAQELFGDALPAASAPEDITRLAAWYLDHPDERARLAAEVRTIVLERHTYAHRALELRDVLANWASGSHIDVAIGSPEDDAALLWGDYHFARALQRSLHRRGLWTRLRTRPEWESPHAAAADVLVHIFGLNGPEAPAPRPGQVSIVWVISHPDLVTDDVVATYDRVYVASDVFAAELATRLGRPVTALHQATDPARFAPTAGGPSHELLFVANSRGVRRRIVEALASTEHDLAVFGRRWDADLLDRRYLRGEYVPNEELAAFYSAASIVLNDHWADMAEHGFMSNRLYDAAASGAFVISDWVEGIDAEFDGGVVTFRTREELRDLVERFLADPDARAVHAGRARAAVLARHTFDDRAAAIVEAVEPLLAERPNRIQPAGGDGQRSDFLADPLVPSGTTT